MLRNYEVPDNFYPMGELESIESLQLELNETRNQMLNHRKRFARKWIYARDVFDEDGVRALESDVDNTMIPIMGDGNPANYIAPLPSIGTPPDFYNQSAMIEEDINTVTGISDYMRGSPEGNIRRTATEAAMIQDAANARARDKLAKVESFLAEVGERIVLLMQQYTTGEHVARITSVAGRAWVNYDADYLQGSYDFEVEGGSTEPRNEVFRRQSALQLVDAMAPFVEIGVVDPMGLARYVLQYGFQIKDVSTLLVPTGSAGRCNRPRCRVRCHPNRCRPRGCRPVTRSGARRPGCGVRRSSRCRWVGTADPTRVDGPNGGYVAATCSDVVQWRQPGTEQPEGLDACRTTTPPEGGNLVRR